MMKYIIKQFITPANMGGLIITLLLAAACTDNLDRIAPGNNSGSNNNNYNATGRLRLLLTDDPLFSLSNISSVTITITKIELRKEEAIESDRDSDVDTTQNTGSLAENAGEMEHHEEGMEENDSTHWEDNEACKCGENGEDSMNYVTVLKSPANINLMDLRNGITSLLSDTTIQAGTYNMIRLFISDANIILADGTSFKLTVPSGSHSGLKIFIPGGIEINGGLSSQLLVDFDLNRSLVVLGSDLHPKGFHLKPVIRVVDNYSCGKIEGFVTDTSIIGIKGAYVWLKNDSVISSAITEENGFYKMIGIPQGTYTLYSTMQGYDTAEVDNVRIMGRSKTIVDMKLMNSPL